MPPLPIPEAAPLSWYLILSAILFALGVAGFPLWLWPRPKLLSAWPLS
jgi:hypothetical protein